MAFPIYIKAANAKKDYTWDWSRWLAGGETISSHTVTADAGITKDSDSKTSTTVTAWLSGGTAGTDYNVVCKATMSTGRIEERTITIRVQAT